MYTTIFMLIILSHILRLYPDASDARQSRNTIFLDSLLSRVTFFSLWHRSYDVSQRQRRAV